MQADTYNLDRQTDRQTDSSVCLLYGRPIRNRQENRQAERTVQKFADGGYP